MSEAGIFSENVVEPVVAEPVAAEPAPAPETPAPVVAEPAAQAPQDHSVPLNVLLRTREEFGGKLSQAEQRAQAAERKLADIERREREAAAQMPDPLEDTQGFLQWQKTRDAERETRLRQEFQGALLKDRLESSEDKWSEKLGDEKFAKLRQWITTWPDAVHDRAERERDPYGWAWREFEKIEKAKFAETVEQKLGGKTLEERIAEAEAQAVATARATWEAEHGPPSEPDASVARAPNGQFASPPPKQRHQPVPLAAIDGASVSRGDAGADPFNQIYKRG